MNEGIITKRYAKALFLASEEEDKTEPIKEDIDSILLTIHESEEFAEFLASPVVKESVKEKLLISIFSDKVDSIVLNFLKLLVKNKREQYLGKVCLQYLQLYKETRGIKEATITTAYQIGEEYRKEVRDYIRKKFKIDVDLTEKTDESLIGGFKLRIEDRQIDASIASKLKKIKTDLINS